MFYLRIFRTKVVFWQLFSSFKPKTQLCNFGAKILYEKRVHKMLMKLTQGGKDGMRVSTVNEKHSTVDFSNIL
jgi:hypothetical protein